MKLDFTSWAKIAIEPSQETYRTQIVCFYEEYDDYQNAKNTRGD